MLFGGISEQAWSFPSQLRHRDPELARNRIQQRVAIGWSNSALNVREPLLGSAQAVGQLGLRNPAPAPLGRNPLSDRDELLHRPLRMCRSRASPYRDR